MTTADPVAARSAESTRTRHLFGLDFVDDVSVDATVERLLASQEKEHGEPVVFTGKDVDCGETRPPFLLGDEDARGSLHRFSPILAGSSEGLMPRARSASDLAHVGPG